MPGRGGAGCRGGPDAGLPAAVGSAGRSPRHWASPRRAVPICCAPLSAAWTKRDGTTPPSAHKLDQALADELAGADDRPERSGRSVRPGSAGEAVMGRLGRQLTELLRTDPGSVSTSPMRCTACARRPAACTNCCVPAAACWTAPVPTASPVSCIGWSASWLTPATTRCSPNGCPARSRGCDGKFTPTRKM